MPLPQYKGEQVFGEFLVTIELIDDSDINDEPEVTILIWDCFEQEWQYLNDPTVKYNKGSWKVVAWRPLPQTYNKKIFGR